MISLIEYDYLNPMHFLSLGIAIYETSSIKDNEGKIIEAKIYHSSIISGFFKCFVAIKDMDEPVGIIIYYEGIGNNNTMGVRILTLWVHRKERNNAIGSMLYQTINEYFNICTTSQKGAVRFFENMGLTKGNLCKDGCFDMSKPNEYWISDFKLAIPEEYVDVGNLPENLTLIE